MSGIDDKGTTYNPPNIATLRLMKCGRFSCITKRLKKMLLVK